MAGTTPRPGDASETTADLYNPYEGRPCAYQISEPVADFLVRLPPASTPASEYGPWIFVANPHAVLVPLEQDLEYLTSKGQTVLDEWMTEKADLEGIGIHRRAGWLESALNRTRKLAENGLLDVAKEAGCTTGKWMLFPPSASVDELWSSVARATVANELGVIAKVATAPDEASGGEGGRSSRVICIYTADFSDVADVKRVLVKLKELGLVEAGGRGIYYKCDAYTCLGIASGNKYGFKASMYSSRELLKEGRRSRW
ncbi:MAG: hypothetical protein M1832_003520 [Thelocarpon impressellum]|nr:MAG: hypothetical protein M1832_003520 [Thelocarpon impressellum]